MSLHQPLELEYWLSNVFSGDPTIFALIGTLAITGMSAYFKMSGLMFFMFLTMFSVILKGMGYPTLLIMIIIIASPILFWWVRRIVD